MRLSTTTRWRTLAAVSLVGMVTLGLAGGPGQAAVTATDWSGYEHGPAHSSAA